MILIYGSGGNIGSEFCSEMMRRGISFCEGEWKRLMGAGSLPRGFKIDLVINCAALVTRPNVDFCDDHKEATIRGNLLLPTILTMACMERGVSLLHVSTGCLYNGDNGGVGWRESDEAQLRFDTGAGWYVGSKQMAEKVVSGYARSYCCRARIPFDHIDGPVNYLSKLMRFKKIVSEPNSLAHRGDFVKACLDMYEKKAPYGIYNMTNPGAMTAREIVELLQELNPKKYEFWDTAEFVKQARCLKSNCVLNTDKLKNAGIAMRPAQEAVVDSVACWKWENQP